MLSKIILFCFRGGEENVLVVLHLSIVLKLPFRFRLCEGVGRGHCWAAAVLLYIKLKLHGSHAKRRTHTEGIGKGKKPKT
jgi:hypothetical protein